MKSVFAVASCLFLAGACTDDNAAPAERSILETAQATPSLSTLVAVADYASQDGDLVDLLATPGSWTVFAPTNDAFDALAVELTGDSNARATGLLVPENRPLLRSVLQYHVLASEVRAAAIPFGDAITTAEGSIFKIEAGSPPQIIDGRNRVANITATDVIASNGVVHVIDRVILPPNQTIVQVAQSNPQFSILVDAVAAGGLVPTLSGEGPFTVFAPTDAAFAALLTELGVTKDQLFANTALLSSVLKYHVVAGRVLKAEAPIGSPVMTVQGGTFQIDGSFRITDGRDRSAQIIATDVFGSNGVIHVIDRVILPPVN